MSKRVQVLISFIVDDNATEGDIDELVTQAAIQIEDPRDMDGNDVEFSTYSVQSSWEWA